jgi:catechol 2,3-dioxygenase-like lactoylglutathione lyase family enzyme
MKIERIHHVAYRCKDAKETVLWYREMLNMEFVLAIAENEVPSTNAPDPYMHVFLDAGAGNVLAFFELPTQPPMGRDPNTPAWVQHIAFKVKDRAELLAFKLHLEGKGIDVLGVTDHGAFHSIYFFDPNGHRLELCCPDTEEVALLERLHAVKWDMLEEWSRTRHAPRHAAFLHQRESAAWGRKE